MRNIGVLNSFIAIGVLLMTARDVQAQSRPWRLFRDTGSISQCDVVNAANSELVVFDATGEMAIVTGANVIIDGLLADQNGSVTYFGQPAGFIAYFLDADGLRSLWWTNLTGELVSIDGFTGEPSSTNEFAADRNGAACDACEFVDDPIACPGDQNPVDPITVDLCDVAVPISANLSLIGLMGMKVQRRRRQRAKLCLKKE